MSKAPELVEAYNLIKAGQRVEANRILKPYLAANPRDIDAWWLMAHAVNKPETVQKCLQQILKLDPDHAKAKEKLARLASAPPAPKAEPGPAAPPPPAEPAATVSRPLDPFATPLDGGFDPYNTYEDAPADPFGAPDAGFSVAPGSGNQPEWGPGLAFVGDVGSDAPPIESADRPKPPQPRKKEAATSGADLETIIGVVVIGVAVIVLIGLGLFMADKRGWIDLGSANKPAMTQLDAISFKVDYPKNWDTRCLSDTSGYPVCGIANHYLYNQVDYYTGRSFDFSTMFAQMSNDLLWGTNEDLPDRQISIVIMDVLPSSPSYDDASWAKTNYEKKEMTVDGHKAYYYEFTSTDSGGLLGSGGQEAVYDVYVPHDGLIMWMTVQIYAEKKGDVPDSLIQDIIRSIKITPLPTPAS